METPIKMDDLGVPLFWKHPSAVQQRPECIEEPFSTQLERENQQTWSRSFL